MNSPKTLAHARGKIAELAEARNAGDLLCRHQFAAGWLSALWLEGLIDSKASATLNAELTAAAERVRGGLN